MSNAEHEGNLLRRAKRLKRNSIILLLLLLAIAALTLAQTWVSVELLPDSGIVGVFEQSGSAAALVALGLALAASIIALFLTGRLLRYFLSILIFVLSVAMVFSIVQIITDPLRFVSSRLAERAGISGPGLEALIENIELSIWPWITLGTVAVIAILAVAIVLTAHRWPQPHAKYVRDDEGANYETHWGRFELDEDEPER